jgi:hypothetical protein
MKKGYFILIVVFFDFKAEAQILTPTVIASTGGFSQNANGSLSYTVGEMTMVQTFSANGHILTQGFQQPNDQVLGLLDLTQDAYGSFVVYPNPAVNDVWFGFQMPEAGKVSIALYNDLGQKISDVYYSNYDNGKIVQQQNVSLYAAGIYFLTMTFTSDKDHQTHISTQKFQVVK